MGCAPSIPAAVDSGPDGLLYVILVLFNPVGFRRRAALFEETLKHVLSFARVRVVTVELTFCGAPSLTRRLANEIAHGGQWVDSLVFDTGDALWAKENLINKGVYAAKARGATRLAWVDADIKFTNKQWPIDTLAALAKYDFVQLWSSCQMMGPDGQEVLQTLTSFASQKAAGVPYAAVHNRVPGYWHPGFAWAATVAALDASCGMMECAALGNADSHLALSLIGRADVSGLP